MSEQEKRQIIRELEITNYRRFKKLRVEKLARVNLFVGKNNSGKTSFLEAVEVLVSQDPRAVFDSLVRRNEVVLTTEKKDESEVDVLHLFSGHGLNPTDIEDLSFEVSSKDLAQTSHTVLCRVADYDDLKLGESVRQKRLFAQGAPEPTKLYFEVSYSNGAPDPPSVTYELSEDFGVDYYDIRHLSRRREGRKGGTGRQVKMLGTSGAANRSLALLWDEVALTPVEREVFDALSILEAGVDGLAFLTDYRSRSPVPVIRINGGRIPLGSMGDGMKRILALVLNLVSAKNGVLLVDEIDTGLHYSVIEDMWRVIIKTAIRLNIQVFATTHSQDCIDALAGALEKEEGWDDEVVQVHRLEADSEKTVPISRRQLITATDRDIEVR